MRLVIDAWAQMIAAARAAGEPVIYTTSVSARYRASEWRFERDRPAPAGPRGPLWRDAKGMSPGSVRAALAAGQKSPGKLATPGNN
jgi:hypothetical protein